MDIEEYNKLVFERVKLKLSHKERPHEQRDIEHAVLWRYAHSQAELVRRFYNDREMVDHILDPPSAPTVESIITDYYNECVIDGVYHENDDPTLYLEF